jgi:peptide/nickel transport system ATP-binding protein
MPDTPVIEGIGLVRDFPSRGRVLRAVRGIDIAVRQRETLGIVGESGCGKSTLARLLLGLTRPTAGEIRVLGQPQAELGRRGLARIVQPVFQDPAAALNPALRIGGIIRLPLDVHGIGSRGERRARVAALMQQVGLAPEMASRLPHEVSGGQRQRVAIARALIAEPRLLVCDEPTSALDVSVQAQILNLLQDLRRDLGLGMVLISHNLGVVEHLADRVMIMYLGRVVESGPARSTLRHPLHPYTDRLRRAVLPPVPGGGVPADEADDLFPDPHDPPSGCAFHPRCASRSDRCVREDPVLTRFGDAAVACHHPLTEASAQSREHASA